MHLTYQLNPDLDPGAVAELRRSVGWEGRLEKIKKALNASYLTAACFDGECLVGHIDVLSDGVEDALVRSLIVHPGYQGKGIGLNLLKIVLEQIRRDRIKTVNVLFEPSLNGFYRRAGFKIVSGGLIDNEKEGFDFK